MLNDQIFAQLGVDIADDREWTCSANSSLKYYYSGPSAIGKWIQEKLNDDQLPSNEEFRGLLTMLTGHFAGIVETNSEIIGFVDTVRSIPVFYSANNGKILVSNSARSLCEVNLMSCHFREGLFEFMAGGYVTGSNTINKDLFQLRAGELIRLDKMSGKAELFRYYRYSPQLDHKGHTDILQRNLGATFDDIFSDLSKELADRTIWVSLSGGLDSRLILAKLHEHGHKRLRAFSYGPVGNREARRAKFVADKLKVPWTYLQTDRKSAAQGEYVAKLGTYWDYADGLASFPSISGYQPLSVLIERNLISQSDVIINGQSGDFLTGGHIPEVFQDGLHKGSELIDRIIQKHFSLWKSPVIQLDFEVIRERISTQLGIDESDVLTNIQAASLYETWEWEERQAKSVVNGQRLYDWHELDWALPLWDYRLIKFFEEVPLHLKMGQRLFKAYLRSYNYYDLFKGDLPEKDRLNPTERVLGAIGAALNITGFEKLGSRLVKLSGYWGKYDYQYQMYGLGHFLHYVDQVTSPPQARGAIALGVAKWLERNKLLEG